LKGHSDNLHIIKAVDGNKLNIDQLKQLGYLKFDHRQLRSGEVGCFFSHLLCWVKILESGAEYGLILEDDIIITPTIIDYFDLIFNDALNYDWDICTLGRNCVRKHYGDSCQKGKELNKILWSPEIPGYGTYAYIIKREAILKISKYVFPINKPIDVMLIDLHKNGDIKIIGTKKNIIDHRDLADSDTAKIGKDIENNIY